MARDPIDKEWRMGVVEAVDGESRAKASKRCSRSLPKDPVNLSRRGRNTCVWNNTNSCVTSTFSHVPLEIHSDRILLFQRLDEIFLDPLSRLKKKSTWKIVRINIPIILISKKDRERNDSFLFSCSIRGNKTIEKWWKKKKKKCRDTWEEWSKIRRHLSDVSRRPRPSYGG